MYCSSMHDLICLHFKRDQDFSSFFYVLRAFYSSCKLLYQWQKLMLLCLAFSKSRALGLWS